LRKMLMRLRPHSIDGNNYHGCMMRLPILQ
jgi:hypothetical protein